ncbi:YppG family protein [Alkalihalobacterium elongatum]|uniref:YppG family protein n=1 Tax=Alkalihalobacterium elongatum TaxID=2675466 RepID=UPI001C1F6604|nr:YppG family protein [Alkalihalobacterium elongatum]
MFPPNHKHHPLLKLLMGSNLNEFSEHKADNSGSAARTGFNPFDYDNHQFEEENPFSPNFMYALPPKPKEQNQQPKASKDKKVETKKTAQTPSIPKQIQNMFCDEDGIVDIDKVEKNYNKFMEYAMKVSPTMKKINDFLK